MKIAVGSTARRVPRVLAALAWGIVGFFVAGAVLSSMSGIGDRGLNVAPAELVASAALVLVARGSDLAGWQCLLRGAGVRVGFAQAARIFATAELVRFLPGGALHLAARYRFSTSAGVSREQALTTMSFDLGLRMLMALALFALSLPLWPSAPGGAALCTLAAVPVVALLLRPRGLAAVARRLGRRRGLEFAAAPMAGRSLLRAGGLVAASWLLRGGAAYLLVRGLSGLPLDAAAPVAGIVAASWLAGVLTPWAPGGLGAREGVGTALLHQLVALPVAALSMGILRLQSVAIELLTALAIVVWDARSRGSARPERAGAGSTGTAEAAR